MLPVCLPTFLPIWLGGAASAAVPVVFDTADSAGVIAEVSRRTGLPETELTAVKLDQLMQAPPGAIGDAALRRCPRLAGPVQRTATLFDVRAEVARGEAAWASERDLYAAIDHLDLAVSTMGCLEEVVDRPLAATAFALRGAVQAEFGELEIARSELMTALALSPDLKWADHWPAAGRTLLDQTLADTTRVRVDVAPDAATSGPWLDGQLLQDRRMVSPGLHLLQFSTGTGIGSAWITLGGDTTVVVPTSYRRPILERILVPDDRQEVEMLLRVAIPNFSVAYVATNGGVWLVAQSPDGQLTTSEVSAPETTPESTGKRKKTKKKRSTVSR